MEFPTLVRVAVYRVTVVVDVTTGLNWSPLTAGVHATVALPETLAEISRVTWLSGFSQSVRIKYPVALEPQRVPS